MASVTQYLKRKKKSFKGVFYYELNLGIYRVEGSPYFLIESQVLMIPKVNVYFNSDHYQIQKAWKTSLVI